MVVLMCGSRDWNDAQAIYKQLARLPVGQHIIRQGGARGADTMAAQIARQMGYVVETYKADWTAYGKRAGFIRNVEMLETAPTPSLVIAFKAKPISPGTDHTIREARVRGIPVRIVTPTSVEEVRRR